MIQTLRENKTLKEMLIGILFSWIVVSVLFFIFSSNAVYNVIGLTIGMIGAAFMAMHMASTIEDAVLLNEKEAISYTRKMTYIRYGVACILLILVGVTDIGSPVMAVFGILLLKLGAYLQPLTHRILCGKEEKNFTTNENQVIMEKVQSNLDSNSDNDSKIQ